MTRTSLALGVDVARLFDSTQSTTQIDADTFPPSNDSRDLLESMIEDAEHEFHQATDDQMKIGTVGLPGTRETYEQVTYDLGGHDQYKRNWTGSGGTYRATERTTALEKKRLLPFDADAGDEAYVYRGMSNNNSTGGWENVTDEEGDLWTIINHRDGRVQFAPILIEQIKRGYSHGLGVGRNQQRELRFAITYRYGSLGGSRNQTAETTTSASISGSGTATVGIGDATGVPSTSEVIVKIDREYLSVRFDPDVPEMEILERGVRGTTAASHDSEATVEYTPPAVRKAVAARAGEQLIVSGRYQDWIADTEDDISKNDMLNEFQAIWETTVGALSG